MSYIKQCELISYGGIKIIKKSVLREHIIKPSYTVVQLHYTVKTWLQLENKRM